MTVRLPSRVEKMQCVFAYTMDRSGHVVSFPLRTAAMHSEEAQALDISGGAAVPFALPDKPCSPAYTWSPEIFLPLNVEMPVISSRATVDKIQSEQVTMSACVCASDSGCGADTPCTYNGSVELVFDAGLGLPVHWEGENRITLLRDGTTPTLFIGTHFRTDVERAGKLSGSDFAAVADICASVLEIGQTTEQPGQNLDDRDRRVTSLAKRLRSRYKGNVWLDGFESLMSRDHNP